MLRSLPRRWAFAALLALPFLPVTGYTAPFQVFYRQNANNPWMLFHGNLATRPQAVSEAQQLQTFGYLTQIVNAGAGQNAAAPADFGVANTSSVYYAPTAANNTASYSNYSAGYVGGGARHWDHWHHNNFDHHHVEHHAAMAAHHHPTAHPRAAHHSAHHATHRAHRAAHHSHHHASHHAHHHAAHHGRK